MMGETERYGKSNMMGETERYAALPVPFESKHSVPETSQGATVNFANKDCGYNDNSRITTEFPCPEQSTIQLKYIE